MKDLQGKVAVITGGAEGIGKAIAAKAAAARMKLVLADLDADRLHGTANEFAAQGAEVITQVTDVADETRIEALAEATYRKFGAAHLLVNNAGVALAKTAWETTRKDWDWVMGVNLFGVTNAIRSFVPRMMAGGEPGHIVNVASAAGLLSVPGLAAYNASKFGVVTLSEGLHHDLTLRNSRIKVSVLCPGWVKTRIAQAERHRAPDERAGQREVDRQTQAIGLSIQQAVEAGLAPEEVADAVFAAVEQERFYIILPERILQGVKVRMEDILEGRQPTLLKI